MSNEKEFTNVINFLMDNPSFIGECDYLNEVTIKDRTKNILKLRLGMIDGDRHSYNAIASMSLNAMCGKRKFGKLITSKNISSSRVAQLYMKALWKICRRESIPLYVENP